MDCEHVHIDLYSYTDGEVRGLRRVRIRRHLRRCPDCSGGVLFRQQMKVVLQRACEQDSEVPEGLAERIRRALED